MTEENRNRETLGFEKYPLPFGVGAWTVFTILLSVAYIYSSVATFNNLASRYPAACIVLLGITLSLVTSTAACLYLVFCRLKNKRKTVFIVHYILGGLMALAGIAITISTINTDSAIYSLSTSILCLLLAAYYITAAYYFQYSKYVKLALDE